MLSLANGDLHQLIDDAIGGAALSPDGSRIAFRRLSTPEIWIMKANGEEARKLLAIPADPVHDSRLAWFPDGRHIAFAAASPAGNQFSIDSYDLETGRIGVILSDRKGGDFCLTPDGRMVYTRIEASPNEKSTNLWELDIDLQTTKTQGAPRRLTNWPDSLFASLGASLDGQRLFFVRLHYQNSVYIGQLEDAGTRLTHARRFSYEQWTNWPTGFTYDSRAVLFNSDRGGRPDIFRQGMEGQGVTALAKGEGERRDARVSADGRWTLYFAWQTKPGSPEAEGQLMRAGADGGPANLVFPVAGHSNRERINPLVSISTEGQPAFRCPSNPQSPCVLTEKVEDQVRFTAFDPLEGRKAELTRIPASSFSFWDLSPDGQWIALGKNEETSGRIRLISLAGKPSREIAAGDWTHLLSVAWASDGRALFVTAFASKGAPLVRVSLEGEAQLLYRGLKYVENPVSSPDGRYLAFGEMTEDGNAWVLDMPKH